MLDLDATDDPLRKYLCFSLFEEVPDFGCQLDYDDSAVASHSMGRMAGNSGKTKDSDVDWGKHETCGVYGRTGAMWKKLEVVVRLKGCT